MTEPHGWLIDTVPSERFPVYTRLNANDVLPDPITPLGASSLDPPHHPGLGRRLRRAGGVHPGGVGAGGVAPVAGFFYGYLYVNQTTVRIDRHPGRDRLAGDRRGLLQLDSPPHEERPDDVNEELAPGWRSAPSGR